MKINITIFGALLSLFIIAIAGILAWNYIISIPIQIILTICALLIQSYIYSLDK